MNWVKKHRLPATKEIHFNKWPCIKLKDLWQALHNTFNSAQDQQINLCLFNKIPAKPLTKWLLFFKVEFTDTIKKYNSLSISGSDHLSWNHLKIFISFIRCISNFVNIVNACINLSFWPSHFKQLTLIIILKPNKPVYNLSKTFCPIILLNILEKLIEKIISKRLQIQSQIFVKVVNNRLYFIFFAFLFRVRV